MPTGLGAAARATALKVKDAAVEYSIYLIMGVLVLMIIMYIYNKSGLGGTDGKNCTAMDTLYSTLPPISSLNASSEQYSHNLRDYYIKTAYNCCCAGQYKNDFVNLCALVNCIGNFIYVDGFTSMFNVAAASLACR